MDKVTFMILRVDEAWKSKQVTSTLLIDIKGAFDQVFQAKFE